MTDSDLNSADYRKSSLSTGTNDNCVEVATNLPGLVAIRDSKDPSGPALAFSRAAWSDFLAGIRNGEI